MRAVEKKAAEDEKGARLVMERAGARPRGREKGHRRLGCPGIKVECQNKVLV